MKAMLIESYEDLSQEDARHYPVEWGVGLDGSPNPEAWNYVACASKEDAIHLCEFLDSLFNGKEQLQVQLAGCSVAALGGLADPAQKGDYGYSPAYQDVIDLRVKWKKAEAELAAARSVILEAYDELSSETSECPHCGYSESTADMDIMLVLKPAALAYREKAEKAGEKGERK